MSRKPRRSFTAEQKAALLRRHHVDLEATAAAPPADPDGVVTQRPPLGPVPPASR